MNLPAFFRPAPFALLVLLALPLVRGVAQQAEPARAPQPAPLDAITLDFPGGPLSKLTAKLNEGENPKLSIVQSPGLDPMLPSFSVREVRAAAVIAALGRILEPQGYALMPIDGNLAVLSRLDSRPAAFVSLQLNRKLDPASGWTTDEIIAAIQMGTEFANPDGKSSTLRFKYHPGTKLLFVAGTPQEVDVAQRVFGSLPDVSPSKESASPPAKK